MKYRMLAHSVLGKKYEEMGWGCQDSSGCAELNDLQVIAVADGHGSNDCFRSAIGSKLAVELTLQQAKRAFSPLGTNDFTETSIRNFKYALWTKWRNLVKKHWINHFNDLSDELRYQSVSEKYKTHYTSEDETEREKYLYRAYGTTLICAISIGHQVLLLQVGDGTGIVLAECGQFIAPIPKDEDNFLNISFSLCDVNEENADEKTRHFVLDYADTDMSPIAVFLSSDGLDDCYPYENNEQYLYKYVYQKIVKYIVENGYEVAASEIKNNLLSYMSNKSSHDDISLACFVTCDDALLKETNEKIATFIDEMGTDDIV